MNCNVELVTYIILMVCFGSYCSWIRITYISFVLSYLLIWQAAKEEIGNQAKKKGGQTKEGIARCTFEDKILMSDIVFLRAWTQVEVPQFYNPLTTALQPREKTWKGMRTVAELRREHNLPVPVNKDSLYKVRVLV